MLRPLQEESTHTPLKLSAKPCSHGSAHVSRPGLCSQEAWAASEGHSSSMKGGTPGRHCGATTWACVAHPGSCVLSTANEAHGGEAEGRIEGRRWREVGGLSAGRGPPGAARRLRAAGSPPSAVSRLWAGKGPSSWQFPPKPRTPHAPPGSRASAATSSPSCPHGDHACLRHGPGPHGARRRVGVSAHRAVTGATLGALPSQPQLGGGGVRRSVFPAPDTRAPPPGPAPHVRRPVVRAAVTELLKATRISAAASHTWTGSPGRPVRARAEGGAGHLGAPP